jgi:hypothetical protein
MARIGTVDERFQSYNVEMVEVTGGRFWKPYGPDTSNARSDLFAYRPPIDLANARLRRLAAALAPAYMRVSGTWANATYFSDSDPAPSAPPDGFNGVLTRQQWRGVVDFSQAVGARIVTSFAISPGTRDAAGVWQPDQARRLLAYTRAVGGTIAAAEFMNEPNHAAIGGAPAGYDAGGYGRLQGVSFVKENFPEMTVLVPARRRHLGFGPLCCIRPQRRGCVSYHHMECCRSDAVRVHEAASEDFARTDQARFHRSLRRFEAGKPIEPDRGSNVRRKPVGQTFLIHQISRPAWAAGEGRRSS